MLPKKHLGKVGKYFSAALHIVHRSFAKTVCKYFKPKKGGRGSVWMTQTAKEKRDGEDVQKTTGAMETRKKCSSGTE